MAGGHRSHKRGKVTGTTKRTECVHRPNTAIPNPVAAKNPRHHGTPRPGHLPEREKENDY